LWIVPENEDVAFPNPFGPQCRQTRFDQPPRNAPPPAERVHRQVMQVAASPVMAAQNRCHHPAGVLGHLAQVGVSIQVGPDGARRIGTAQADALAAFPELPNDLDTGAAIP